MRVAAKSFVCVYTFDESYDDFVLIGIFTKQEDAERFKEAEAPNHRNKIHIVPNELKAIEDQIISVRLGKLKDVLLRIETRALGEIKQLSDEELDSAFFDAASLQDAKDDQFRRNLQRAVYERIMRKIGFA